MTSVRTIVVVGPSDERRARLGALLAGAGHAVIAVATTQEAVAHIIAEGAPLVILEFAANDQAAHDVCRLIKQSASETFILQIAPDVGNKPTTEIAGCIDAYLVEPVHPQEMLALVRSLLRLQKVEADLRDSEERLLLAQDSAGLAILDWTVLTNALYHSGNLLELFDCEPLEPGTTLSPKHLLDRIHPEDLGALISEFTTTTQTARTFDKEFRIVRRDGQIRWIASRGRFFSGIGGHPERMLSLSFDVTRRKAAERMNAELASIVASSIDGIVSVDLSGIVTSWNAGADRLLGLHATDMIGGSLDAAFSDMPATEKAAHRQYLIDGEAYEFDTRQTRADGEPIDLWVTSAPMREPDGRVIGSSFILRDVSRHKQREDHVRFLMRELTHRSKNLLAVIQAMARQSMTSGVTPEEFVRRFSERLAGLAGSHDLLSSVDWKGASLMDLIRSQLSHYAELFGTRIKIEGADVFVRPEAAQNIGIALHELSTNAAKYGALSNEGGTIAIAWRFEPGIPRRFVLSWREAGGPKVEAPTRKGFGTVVMDRIAGRALGGTSAVGFEPGGVVWTLEVPAAAAVND